MIYLLLAQFIVVCALAWQQFKPAPKPAPVEPNDSAVEEAIMKAAAHCGVNVDLMQPKFDLLHTGKLGEIIYHASIELGRPIRTVQDVHDWFK